MAKENGKIIYSQSGSEGLDAVAGLWLKLRQHHKERSPYFKEDMDSMKWEERKQGLLDKSGDRTMLVETARDGDKLVGYCVSSISGKKEGEIESIYVEKEYRKQHIGGHFMKSALAWMDKYCISRRIIGVAAGNEEVFGFYRKFGFYPRVTVLRQKSNKASRE